MTEFVLVRHGETAWNEQGKLQGRTDVPLNDIGLAQAAQVAEALRGSTWDLVCSSPLQRAWQTAIVIRQALGLDAGSIRSDDDLRERAYGAAEGLTIAERDARYPDHIWPGAETTPELTNRAARVMASYAEIYSGQRVLIVSHGGWIRGALRALSGHDRRVIDRAIPNVSRTYVKDNDGHWEIGEIAIAPDEDVLAQSR